MWRFLVLLSSAAAFHHPPHRHHQQQQQQQRTTPAARRSLVQPLPAASRSEACAGRRELMLGSLASMLLVPSSSSADDTYVGFGTFEEYGDATNVSFTLTLHDQSGIFGQMDLTADKVDDDSNFFVSFARFGKKIFKKFVLKKQADYPWPAQCVDQQYSLGPLRRPGGGRYIHFNQFPTSCIYDKLTAGAAELVNDRMDYYANSQEIHFAIFLIGGDPVAVVAEQSS